MIVLDTNVVSELMLPSPSPSVVRWVSARPAAEMAVTAMTAAELLHGVGRLPAGARRDRLARGVATLLDEVFAGRVLPFDGDAAVEYAAIVSRRESTGRPVSTADAVVAATARAHGARLIATRDVAGFADVGVDVVDPWREGR